jgi:hypothetical protein
LKFLQCSGIKTEGDHRDNKQLRFFPSAFGETPDSRDQSIDNSGCSPSHEPSPQLQIHEAAAVVGSCTARLVPITCCSWCYMPSDLQAFDVISCNTSDMLHML